MLSSNRLIARVFPVMAIVFSCTCHPDGSKGHAGEPPDIIYQSLDPQKVEVEGEIGRRMDLVMNTNIPKINLDSVFLRHFRNKRSEPLVRDGFVGTGMMLDALVGMAYYTQDPEMIERKKYLADELIKTQEDNGYIGIYTPDKRRKDNWDTHEGGYIILALASDYLLFGEEGSLRAAQKYADHLIESRVERMTGLDDAFLQLYHATGDRKYVNYCIEEFNLPRFTFQRPDQARHVYGYLEMALMQLKLYEIEPVEELLYKPHVAVEFLLNIDAMDITGGSGMWEHFNTSHEGHDCNAETCATAYIIWLMDALLRIEGNSFYGDIMERSLYNALFAALSPTGDSIRYFTDYESAKEYYPDDYFCCPNNFRRIILDLPELIYYQSDRGIAVNLYNPSEAVFTMGGQQVVISQETDYPSSGKITLYVEPESESRFIIDLRIPSWCSIPSVKVNGLESEDKPVPGTFYRLDGTWKKGDMIELFFPMEYRLVQGRSNQWSKVALMRGPVVYGLNNANNPWLKGDSDVVIDPGTISEPVPDNSFRPGGKRCSALTAGEEKQEVIFTEYIDPEGIKTFFHITRGSMRPEPDELVSRQYNPFN